MKMLGLYIKERKIVILLLLAVAAVFAAVQALYVVAVEPVLYALELCMALYFMTGIVDFLKFCRKHRALMQCIQMKDICELQIEPPSGCIEQAYYELAERLVADKTQLAQAHLKAMTELKDYYAVWAHQIKTPISAVNLLLQEMPPDAAGNMGALKQEIFKIDFYADAVMDYLRLEDLSSDFNFGNYALDKMVKKAVRKFAPQFIHKKISVELDKLDDNVYTDERWFTFIIEQLLSNAVKYTDAGGRVLIYQEKPQVLVVEDNGIGISSEDLPRIMERGYTGYNGRMDKKSSGIGLYLCKKAAEKLGIKITFSSVLRAGTKVYIDVRQETVRHE